MYLNRDKCNTVSPLATDVGMADARTADIHQNEDTSPTIALTPRSLRRKHHNSLKN